MMAVGLRRGRKLLPARAAVLGGALALSAGCADLPPPTTGVADQQGTARTSLSAQAHARQRFGTFMRLGDAARRSGDAGAAASLYQQATAVEPRNPRGHVALGEALLDSGAPADAAKAFEEARRLAPGESAAEHGYARAMIALKRPERAIERYAALVAADPRDLRAVNGLGVAYDLAGRHAEAQATYRGGLAREPDDLTLRNNLGLSLVLANHPEEAIPILRRAAESHGATARVRQNLALAYGLVGDVASAERVARIDLDADAVASNLAVYEELRARGGEGAAASVPPPVGRAAAAPPPLIAAATDAEPLAAERQREGRAAARPSPPPEVLAPKPIVIKLDAQLPSANVTEAAADRAVVQPRTSSPPAAGDRQRRDAGTVAAVEERVARHPVAEAAAPAAAIGPAAAERRPDAADAAVAVDAGADLLLGASLGGSWFLELGEYPDGRGALAAWRDLRGRYPAALAGLSRLAGLDRHGPQPLLVGPLGSGAAARELCLRLKGDGATCRPVLL